MLASNMEDKCSISSENLERLAYDISKAARLLGEAYVKEGYFGPIDRLGTAKSREAVLVALYEVLRGLPPDLAGRDNLKDSLSALERVVNAVIEDLEKDKCFERAVRLANMLGVKALATGRG